MRGLAQSFFKGRCSSKSAEKSSLPDLLDLDRLAFVWTEGSWACLPFSQVILFQLPFPLGCLFWLGPDGDSVLCLGLAISLMGFRGLLIYWASWRGALGRPTRNDLSLVPLPEPSLLCLSRKRPFKASNLSPVAVTLSPCFFAVSRVNPSCPTTTLVEEFCPFWKPISDLARHSSSGFGKVTVTGTDLSLDFPGLSLS